MDDRKDLYDDMTGPLPAWAEWVAVIVFVILVFAKFV